MNGFLLRLLLSFVLLALVCDGSHAVGKITRDPNAGGATSAQSAAQPDARLAQKVSYEARFQTVQQILDDLSEMTGIKLCAGANKSDWTVRARKMNIFVKDVTLADLMNSIAHVMKFAWSRNDDVNPPTYRLLVDKKAAIAADAQKATGDKKSEEIWQKKRQDWIDTIEKYGSLAPDQFESLRDADPIAFEYGRRGAIRALNALFKEVPETKERFAAGRSFRIFASKLSADTKSSLYFAASELRTYLERVGYVGPGVIGLHSLLNYDDDFDITFGRLDVEFFTPNLCWGSASLGNTGYFSIEKDGRDYEIAGLPSRDSAWDRMRSIAHNKITDGTDPEITWNSGSAPVSNPWVDQKKKEELLYPSEPINEHPDFPELKKTIKLKIDPPKPEQNPVLAINNYICSFQKALADGTGLGIVSDSWANIEGDRLPDQEATLSELLNKFSEQFNYNWDKSSTIMEFRHRKWWKNRLNQVPDEWIAPCSDNTRKNRILSLDDLAQISTLNYYQAEEAMKPDKVLGTAGIYRQILKILDAHGNLYCLRLYSTLSPQLRTLLMSERGINGQMLTSDQWKQAQVIFDRIGSSRGDAIFRIEREPHNILLIYRFKETDNETGEVDRDWRIILPKYTPPSDEKEAKQ